MPTVPLASYKVAVVNERFEPLVGVEVEAMNLTTLNPDQVQETGDDGIATFTSLPAGPHFFKVRATRHSTKVGGRTYTGAIHIQIVSIGGSGIVKHCIVDANGFGTHTTIQAAVTAVLALGANFQAVIYINPGTYIENVVCNFALTAGSIYFVGEGTAEDLKSGNYNAVVGIAASTQSSPVFSFDSVGSVQMVGLSVLGYTGGAIQLGDGVTDELDFEAKDCKFETGGAQTLIRGGTGSIGALRFLDCILKANSTRLVPNLNLFLTMHHCYIKSGGIVRGDFTGIDLDNCIIWTYGLSATEWAIEETALVISYRVNIQNCLYVGGGQGFIKFGQGNAVSNTCFIIGNEIANGVGDTAIWLLGVLGAVVSGNIIEGSSASDGGTAIRITNGDSPVRANVIEGNSIRDVQNGLVVDGPATDGSNKFGANAYSNVGVPTAGVPAAEDFQEGTAYAHILLDGAMHTDTLLGVVVDGDTIIGNITPKWSRLAISIPAANVRNVLGIDNAELRPSWKTALDGTAPADIAAAASPGTSLIFAHRDHVHALGAGAVGAIDHNSLSNLAVGDVHTQYALLAGRSGGQTLIGGTAAGEDLTLQSTAHATKGSVFLGSSSLFELDETTGQAKIPTVGSGAGVLIGGDVQLYRSAANVLRTPDALAVDTRLVIGGATIYPNVLLNLMGTTTSGDNAFGMYMGGLSLDPADGWNSYAGYFGGVVIATAATTVVQAVALFAATQTKSGTGAITTAYGVYIQAPTIGTTNIGLSVGGLAEMRNELSVASYARVASYLRVGSLTAPSNYTGGDLNAIRLFVGADAVITTGFIADIAGAARVGGNLRITGDLDHDGLNVGFYGTAPVALQTGVAVTAAGIHAALVALGLITA